MSKILSFLKQILLPFFRYVRVVYIYGKIPDKTKDYHIGDKIINGSEAYEIDKPNKPIKYYVSLRKTIKIFVPMFVDYMPFKLLPEGKLTPNWKCDAKGQELDYIYWIPEDYKD